MAAKKKRSKPTPSKSKKKTPASRKKVRVEAPRVTAPPAELKELDSGWRSFIRKSVPDVPLTEVWEEPKGAPSAKTTIRKAALKKAARKAAKKGPSSSKKKAPARSPKKAATPKKK